MTIQFVYFVILFFLMKQMIYKIELKLDNHKIILLLFLTGLIYVIISLPFYLISEKYNTFNKFITITMIIGFSYFFQAFVLYLLKTLHSRTDSKIYLKCIVWYKKKYKTQIID